MDIADDNLTLPLPSALIKQQMQRGVGFLVDDGDDGDDSEAEMDVTQPLGGIIPARDGVNRFLSGADEDQTMEFTQVYPAKPFKEELDDDTMAMDFTRVVGKIQGANFNNNAAADKENLPPQQDDDDSMPHIKPSNSSDNGHDSCRGINPQLQVPVPRRRHPSNGHDHAAQLNPHSPTATDHNPRIIPLLQLAPAHEYPSRSLGGRNNPLPPLSRNNRHPKTDSLARSAGLGSPDGKPPDPHLS